jgi:hypothetical protein
MVFFPPPKSGQWHQWCSYKQAIIKCKTNGSTYFRRLRKCSTPQDRRDWHLDHIRSDIIELDPTRFEYVRMMLLYLFQLRLHSTMGHHLQFDIFSLEIPWPNESIRWSISEFRIGFQRIFQNQMCSTPLDILCYFAFVSIFVPPIPQLIIRRPSEGKLLNGSWRLMCCMDDLGRNLLWLKPGSTSECWLRIVAGPSKPVMVEGSRRLLSSPLW